jgi:hypothetical protein
MVALRNAVIGGTSRRFDTATRSGNAVVLAAHDGAYAVPSHAGRPRDRAYAFGLAVQDLNFHP